MYRFSVCAVCFFVLLAGCSSRNIDKHHYYEKGLNDLEKGNLAGSIAAFKKAIEQDQSYFEARYQMAQAYILQGRHDTAERELRKVLYLNPSLVEARLALAKVYLALGKTDSAGKEIEAYLRTIRDNPEAYEVAASIHASRGDLQKSEETGNMSPALPQAAVKY